MSSLPIVVSTPPTLRIEELFVRMLQADPRLEDLEIVAASDRDATVPPTHCFVYCTSAIPIMNSGQNYRANVSIACVSNIDDEAHIQRKANFTLLLAALTRIEAYIRPDAILLAWPVQEITEASSDQQAADIVKINAAAFVAG